ncbi:amidohydrolase family protein [Frigoribacterium sp. CFBP 8751]|uniref:amidohydrolase family protein n=1 Tax=Frigoribacterium sp. CFBP 8751 TaxID=2775277 RepID=UPI001784CB9F|nr:amidohydrolase family protein [Frigoribacterium sp. CFBP 8751]MBD8540511.1 amidohydrolase family protein [Frigoribacterium sp. CFBP 8751]
MSLIGIEEHWTTPELKAALESLPPELRDDSLAFNERGDHLTRLEDVGDGRIAAMDEQGIDVQVLSVAPPANGPLPAADARRLARDLNDLAAEAVSRHPTRLLALATLPMADPQAVSGEFERASAAGFVGAMVYGRTGDVPLDDPRYDDLFSTAARLGRPLFIHPQIPTKEVRAAQYGGLGDLTGLALSTFAWGWHLEAATAALRLIASGAFDRHPELQIVLGHWGELLLFWLSRADGLSGLAGLDRTVSEYVRQNVHITASGMFEPALLRHALEVTTIDRLLFSTDYPFQHPTGDEVQAFLGEFATDADRDAFACGNAAHLFGIDV